MTHENLTLVLLVAVILTTGLLLRHRQRLRQERQRRLAAEEARRRSDSCLRDSQQLLSLILDSTTVGMSVSDEQGRLVYVNQTYARICGQPAAQLVGLHFQSVLPDKHHAALAALHSEVIQGQEPTLDQAEWTLVRPDGTQRIVSASHRLLTRGDGRRFRVATITDLTERKRAEQDLRERDLQLQRSMDVIPGVVYQYCRTAQGQERFACVSQGAEEVWGLAPAQALADVQSVWGLARPEDLTHLRQTLDESAQKLTPWCFHVPIRTPQGQRKWLRGQSKPLRQPDGSIVWHGVAIDTSAEVQARQALVESEARWRSLVEHLPDVVLIVDRDGTIQLRQPGRRGRGGPRRDRSGSGPDRGRASGADSPGPGGSVEQPAARRLRGPGPRARGSAPLVLLPDRPDLARGPAGCPDRGGPQRR